MQQKIIISDFYNIAAIVHENKVQDLIFGQKSYQINNVYIGLVNKIFPGIDAAFINIDYNYKSGFIHASDIHFLSKKRYYDSLYKSSISDRLIIGQKLVVQILKEASAHKGPRLTTNITLVGRYLVLTPFSKSISVSRTVEDSDERNYLKALAVLIRPSTMGLLLKSSIIGVSEDAIIQELTYLKKQWNFIQKIACTALAPKLIYSDHNLVYKVLRDFYKVNTFSIFVDTPSVLASVQRYLSNWFCSSLPESWSLSVYNDIDVIFEDNGITSVFHKALFNKVELPLGAYIFIDTVEALTIIDVNSGGFNKSLTSKESILEINVEASKEIAYQLKIRNIAGLILIDFIDMYSVNDQIQLLKCFQKCLESDPASPQIVQLSELGLVELTRRRSVKSFQEVFPKLLEMSAKEKKKNIKFSKICQLEARYFGSFSNSLLPNVNLCIANSITYQSKILTFREEKKMYLNSYLSLFASTRIQSLAIK
nr:Rne [Erythrotrichia welwitschii]